MTVYEQSISERYRSGPPENTENLATLEEPWFGSDEHPASSAEHYDDPVAMSDEEADAAATLLGPAMQRATKRAALRGDLEEALREVYLKHGFTEYENVLRLQATRLADVVYP